MGRLAGALVFGALVGLGGVLSSRVGNPIPVVVLAVAGAYGGWLLGVIVFPMVTFAFFFLDERWNVGPSGRAVFYAVAWTCSLPALAWFGQKA